MIRRARLQARGERGGVHVVQLVGVHRDRETRGLRGLEHRTRLLRLEHRLLDEAVDRFREVLGGDGPDRRLDRPKELAPLDAAGHRVKGQVGHRDVHRRFGPDARDEPQLPELLVGLEPIPALDLDGRRAERHGASETRPGEREEGLVGRFARRAHGRVDPAAPLEHGEIVGATLSRRELVPPLTRVAEVRVRIDEAGKDDTAPHLAFDRTGGQLELLPAIAAAGRQDRPVACHEPAVVDGADVAGRRPDPRLLQPEGRERQQAGTADEEIGLGPIGAHPGLTRGNAIR